MTRAIKYKVQDDSPHYFGFRAGGEMYKNKCARLKPIIKLFKPLFNIGVDVNDWI